MSDEPEPRTECQRCHRRYDIAETHDFAGRAVCLDCVDDEIAATCATLDAALAERDEARREAEQAKQELAAAAHELDRSGIERDAEDAHEDTVSQRIMHLADMEAWARRERDETIGERNALREQATALRARLAAALAAGRLSAAESEAKP